MKLFSKQRDESPKQAASAARFPWGGTEFTSDHLAPHYAVMGMTSSGKTLTIRMLMRAVLVEDTPDGGPKLRYRAMVYDPKRDFYPLLRGMGVPAESIVVLHAFDQRAHVWNLAKDVTSYAAARQLAVILCPADKEASQPFFSNSAQDLLAGVIDNLRVKAGEHWTLNDVLEAIVPRSRLKAFLEQTPDGTDLVAFYFGNDDTVADILSTLRTKLAPFQGVARIWARIFHEQRERCFSLTEWALPAADGSVARPRVLLLGTDDTNADSLEPINRALFKRASQLVTGRTEEDPGDHTWFFLDEARWLGELDGLQGLLLKGRSKGAHVVLGFQDLQGLKHVYGEFQAEELVAQCGNIAVLRLNSPETMEWASRYFGRYQGVVRSVGVSHTTEGKTVSTNDNPQEVPAILPQTFRLLPLPSKSTGITGAFASPASDAGRPGSAGWRYTIPPSFIERFIPTPARSDDPAFEERDGNEQDKLPWSVARKDDERLHLPSTILLPPPTNDSDGPEAAGIKPPLPR